MHTTYYFKCLCGHRFPHDERSAICPRCGEDARLYGLKDSTTHTSTELLDGEKVMQQAV